MILISFFHIGKSNWKFLKLILKFIRLYLSNQNHFNFVFLIWIFHSIIYKFHALATQRNTKTLIDKYERRRIAIDLTNFNGRISYQWFVIRSLWAKINHEQKKNAEFQLAQLLVVCLVKNQTKPRSIAIPCDAMRWFEPFIIKIRVFMYSNEISKVNGNGYSSFSSMCLCACACVYLSAHAWVSVLFSFVP